MTELEELRAKVARVEALVADWQSCQPMTNPTQEDLDEIRAALADPDPCPECGTNLVCGPGGGVKCPKGACGYWFCY